MTETPQGVPGPFEEAERELKRRESVAAYKAFATAYRREHMRGGFTWPTGLSAPHISFLEDSERRFADVEPGAAGRIADRLLAKEISDVEMTPVARGTLTGSVRRALKKALSGRMDLQRRMAYLDEAMAGLYLTGRTESRTLLHSIEERMKAPELGPLSEHLGLLLGKYGMVDEYHKDLRPVGPRQNDPSFVLAVIERKLRPLAGSEAELFEQGYLRGYVRGRDEIWGNGVYAAKTSFQRGGVRESRRLEWGATAPVADDLHSGSITDLSILPFDRGLLSAAVMRATEYLSEHTTCQNGDELRAREIVAGLYLLGTLGKPEGVAHITKLLQARPDLVGEIRPCFEQYQN